MKLNVRNHYLPASRPRVLGAPIRQPRGSILVFAIALLSILAMLGTAYLMIIQQSSKASTNSMINIQSDMAAQSGVKHAVRLLRVAAIDYQIFTPIEIYDPTQPNFMSPASPASLTNAVLTNSNTTGISPLARFQLGADGGPGAILSDIHGGPDHYSSEPLGAGTNPYDLMYTAVGPFPMDQARQIDMLDGRTAVGGNSISEFYHTPVNPKVKELPQITNNGARGRYYVWIVDMDSKFYAVPQDWGVDNTNTAYAPVAQAWNVPVGPPNAEYVIRQNILASLAYSSGVGSEPQVFATSDILAWDNVPYTANNTDSRFPNYRTNKEVALVAPSTAVAPKPTDPAATINAYQLARANIDYYLNPYKDTAYFLNPIPLKFAKDWSSAININTAEVEVIAAALSQIPSDDRSDFGGTPLTPPKIIPMGKNYPVAGFPSLAQYLANRIVAKRPFLCRMDFEDFLAAQIMGTVGQMGNTWDMTTLDDTINPYSDNGSGTGQVIPEDTDPMWTQNATDTVTTYWSTNDPVPIAYLLYFTIGRRLGPGNTTFIAAPAATDPQAPFYNWLQSSPSLKNLLTTPEMTLSQFLEIPGVPETHPVYQHANWPVNQKARFRYFFGNAAERQQIVNVEQSLITAREFNNIINSITAIYVNGDTQVIFPDASTNVGSATVVVTPDAVTGMNTTPQGDDQFVFDAAGKIIGINAGPNGIPETWISLNRPSYYSYFNDAAFADDFFTRIDQGGWTRKDTVVSNGTLADYAATLPPAPNPFFDAKSLLDPAIASVHVDISDVASPVIQQLVGDPVKHSGLMYQMKYFYLPRVTAGKPAPPVAVPPTLTPLDITDLMYVRCRPYNSALTSGRSGMYQMSFDDWTSVSPTTNYAGSLGMMLTVGDSSVEHFSDDYSVAASDSGAKANGDVNWSPQFCFRSRFFGVYVLGRGLVQTGGGANTVGERRLEAVYDAIKDEVLWQRSPDTELKALGDP